MYLEAFSVFVKDEDDFYRLPFPLSLTCCVDVCVVTVVELSRVFGWSHREFKLPETCREELLDKVWDSRWLSTLS